MTTDRPSRISGFRVVLALVVLVNLILTIALITQVREIQQRVARLPSDLATKRDVASLRPLQVRQIIQKNCVECHSARRLGETAAVIYLGAAAYRLVSEVAVARAMSPDGQGPTIAYVLTGSTWGEGWLVGAIGATVVLAGLLVSRRAVAV